MKPGERAQWVKALAVKSDSLSWVPEIRLVEGKN